MTEGRESLLEERERAILAKWEKIGHLKIKSIILGMYQYFNMVPFSSLSFDSI